MPKIFSSESEIQGRYSSKLVAAEYVEERFTTELNRLLHNCQVDIVNKVTESIHPRRILEIAPGPGRVTRDIHSPGTLVCLEYNKGMIEQGRLACNENARWSRGNGFELPFVKAFDLVYSFRFVRHFRRADRERLYAEIFRVLNPGGYFIMDAVNDRISRPIRDADPEAYPIYDKLYRLEALRRELTEAGLKPLDCFPVQKCYRWQYRSQVLLGPRANWANRLLIHALEWLPRRDGLEWVVTCRRE